MKFNPEIDDAPGSLGAAIRLDLREEAAIALVAKRMGVTTWAAYKRLERTDQRFTDDWIEAVIEATGGAHTRAYLDRLAGAQSETAACHFRVPIALGETLTALAETLAQATADLAPNDDTPGRYDRAELRRLTAALQGVQARVASVLTEAERLEPADPAIARVRRAG